MQSSKKRTLLNKCIAAGITAVIMLLIAVLFDYYFDLNDDVFMKNILSGSYTGIPEDHNIQMLYPISALISLVYRLFRGADVYGIFLCSCQFFCVFAVLGRLITACRGIKGKIIAAILTILITIGCLLCHLVYVQYTFTVALLSATAAFFVMTGEGRKNRIAVCVIIWLSFLIRSEMLLLMLPMAGFAWLYRFVKDVSRASDYVKETYQNSDLTKDMTQDSGIEKKNIKVTYIRWALILFAGLFLCKGIDKIAYSSDSWSEFVDLFDARTELYDYQSIPPYEGNEEFYDSIGLDDTEVELFFNYNYGLDSDINADTMDKVATYAKSIKEETPMLQRIRQALYLYVYRLHHFGFQKEYQYPMTDAPFNLMILIMYIGIAFESVVAAFSGKSKKSIRELAFLVLLFIIRTLLWMYIIVGERDPIRITHGLMIMEMGVLGGLFSCNLKSENKNAVIKTSIALVMIVSLVYIPNTVSIARSEADNRAVYNEKFNELFCYIKDNPDNFYWIDLYTSVSYTSYAYTSYSYSEKMFEDVSNSFDNYDTLGGWTCNSPLQRRKMDKYGFADIQSALLTDSAYFVITDESSTDFLVAYYNNKGIKISLEEVDLVADKFRIIKLSED